MKLTRYSISACCGKQSIIFTTDCPLSHDHINKLKNMGFAETSHFTKAGIMYMTNSDFIITGPLGSNRLQLKFTGKNNNDSQKLSDIEALLQQL